MLRSRLIDHEYEAHERGDEAREGGCCGEEVKEADVGAGLVHYQYHIFDMEVGV